MVACEGCVARVADADSSNVGWRGTPGIVDRPEPLDATIVETSLAVPVIDLAPIAAQPDPVWLLLAEDGRIGRGRDLLRAQLPRSSRAMGLR